MEEQTPRRRGNDQGDSRGAQSTPPPGGYMPTGDALADLLKAYIVALSDPTRATILGELGHAGELTPTQIAKRLGLTANNVYHHIRVLRGMGLLAEPRAVPGPTYVEKYYRVRPELEAATADPNWPERVHGSMTPEQRQAFICAQLLEMASALRRAAQRYATMDPTEFDRYRQEQILMTSGNEATRARLISRLRAWREELEEEYARMPPAEDTDPRARTDLLLMVGLPDFWDPE